MEKALRNFFKKENIDFYRSFILSENTDIRVISPRRLPDFAKSVAVFLIPYFSGAHKDRNVSYYAVPQDYHFYIKQLEQRLTALLSEKKINYRVRFFSDTSPFCERELAAKAGLGFIGENGLLINPVYGSFCFVGELVTDFSLDISSKNACAQTKCLSCGKCRKLCPGDCFSENGGECLSELTQKKRLSKEEENAVASHPLVWGCDICQEVCPHNIGVRETPIEFFRSNTIPSLSCETLAKMSDEEFEKRAYSWRGRAVIERNLMLKEKCYK